MPESLEPEMSVDEAIGIINQYLAKNGAKDSQGRIARINKYDPDWERGISLIELTDSYNEKFLIEHKIDEYEKLGIASHIATKYFFTMADQALEAKQTSPSSLKKEEKTPPPLVFSNPKKRAITEDGNVRAPDHERQRVEDKTNNVAPLTPPKTNRLKPPSA